MEFSGLVWLRECVLYSFSLMKLFFFFLWVIVRDWFRVYNLCFVSELKCNVCNIKLCEEDYKSMEIDFLIIIFRFLEGVYFYLLIFFEIRVVF